MYFNAEEHKKLLAVLESSGQSIDVDGLPVRVKPIPDAGYAGDIDPRVLRLNAATSADPGPERIDLTDMAPLRAAMNWKSFDITEALIETRHLSFETPANTVRLRVYTPVEQPTGKKPCILYFHGGGWIGGEMAYVENSCKLLAEAAGAVVVSAQYRFAPEHPFPAAFEDCWAAVEYLHSHPDDLGIDPGNIAVCGDSAGGNLAACCALKDRDDQTGYIRFQALVYPSVNPCQCDSPYYTWREEAYGSTGDRAAVMELVKGLPVMRCLAVVEEAYVQGKNDPATPYIAPLFAADLKGMAPALIITPEYDYLRQEGEAYARRLLGDGVEISVIRYKGMDHGFFEKAGQYPQAADAAREIARAFKQQMA